MSPPKAFDKVYKIVNGKDDIDKVLKNHWWNKEPCKEEQVLSTANLPFAVKVEFPWQHDHRNVKVDMTAKDMITMGGSGITNEKALQALRIFKKNKNSKELEVLTDGFHINEIKAKENAGLEEKKTMGVKIFKLHDHMIFPKPGTYELKFKIKADENGKPVDLGTDIIKIEVHESREAAKKAKKEKAEQGAAQKAPTAARRTANGARR